MRPPRAQRSCTWWPPARTSAVREQARGGSLDTGASSTGRALLRKCTLRSLGSDAETQNSKPKTQNPEPKTQTPNLKPKIQNPKSEVRNPKTKLRNHKPGIRNSASGPGVAVTFVGPDVPEHLHGVSRGVAGASHTPSVTFHRGDYHTFVGEQDAKGLPAKEAGTTRKGADNWSAPYTPSPNYYTHASNPQPRNPIPKL